ncbi:MAG: bile acid:sodium symporter family protein [Coriobacteriaceae bacterium]|nr:bile acid:sodium symporter family protein [Coriobacteriaceae bacterium]
MFSSISRFVKTFMPVIVLAVAALTLFVPETGLWVQTAWINPLLMVVLFGMGLTMNVDDFLDVFKHPKDCLVGVVAQYVVMPLSAFAIGMALQLEPALLAGLVLVGTCPGGTASDVMTYLAKGDVALSVSVTAVNTALAPLLTPLITLLLLQTVVNVDVISMFISILQVAIIPIVLGLCVNHFFPKVTDAAGDALPLVSVAAICLIIAAVVSHNAQQIFETGATVFAAVILLNLAGYALGYGIGVATGMRLARRKALSLEIGMQNSGLATSLALTVFPGMALATVPGAVFSVWHNISGSLLAALFRRIEE